ncbi:hypothetical protein PsorP6_014114 [Peronosclerospora sorghi]|uniref:Uncharacterized protein n=1 Tax=Peronosclerospora sorghi TaxID=230839 RepID=A0ACC0VJY5_9STRA|nr:hypothetical protein PsorP6_014114 [Peronosclerospora sorghi]
MRDIEQLEPSASGDWVGEEDRDKTVTSSGAKAGIGSVRGCVRLALAAVVVMIEERCMTQERIAGR